MSAHDETNRARLEELRADRALAGLSPAEANELASLSRAAQRDADAIDDLELAAAALDLALFQAEDVALSPSLRSRILTAADLAIAAKAPQAAYDPRPRPRASAWVWLAAAALLIAALAGWWPRIVPNRPLDLASAVARLEQSGTLLLKWNWTALEDPAAKGAGGSVIWSDARQEGYLRISGLAPNDAKREQYQLWIFDAERPAETPVDGGVFDIHSGQEIIPMRATLPVGKATMFAVTVERPGGVVVSKRERLVLLAKAD